jgi:hypothetical protein
MLKRTVSTTMDWSLNSDALEHVPGRLSTLNYIVAVPTSLFGLVTNYL